MLHLPTPDQEQGLCPGIVDRRQPAHVYSMCSHMPCLNLTTGLQQEAPGFLSA